MSLLFLAYGALALVALALCWRDPDMRVVGGALAISWTCSNLVWFSAPVAMRPGTYTMLEIMVAVAAWISYAIHRHWALRLVVVAALLSICANVGLASVPDPTRGQKNLHEVLTNLCFAAECILAAWAGWRIGKPEHWDGPVHIGRGGADRGKAAAHHAGPPEP